MMKSGAAMPAAVDRITAANNLRRQREQPSASIGAIDASAGAEQEFEQVSHETPA
jgi:hypothetical protein